MVFVEEIFLFGIEAVVNYTPKINLPYPRILALLIIRLAISRNDHRVKLVINHVLGRIVQVIERVNYQVQRRFLVLIMEFRPHKLLVPAINIAFLTKLLALRLSIAIIIHLTILLIVLKRV